MAAKAQADVGGEVLRPVLNKQDFVRRYAAGEFGNASPTWNGLDEFLADGYTGLVHVRNRVAGAPTWYNIPARDVAATWRKALETGYGSEQLYISAMAPTTYTLFQGEVLQSAHSLDLLYTTVAKPMRDALRQWSRHVSGIVAILLLRYYLCPNSYDWLNYLLTAYPAHAVEFSTYAIKWGTIPGFNTVFWEVRLY